MLKTILVALDVEPDPLAGQIMQTLRQLSLEPVATVILAHVILATQTEAEVVDRPQSGLESSPHDQIEKQLHSYQKTLPCQSQVEIVTGEPVEEIIRLANIYKADLILIGSRGLTGMQRILLGSVSSQIATDAPCSVLVVKPNSWSLD